MSARATTPRWSSTRSAPAAWGRPCWAATPRRRCRRTSPSRRTADGTVSQAQVSISPSAGNLALGPGTYQLDILPGTVLASVFSSFYPSSAWAGSQPVPIAQFTVLGPGVTLGDAIKLGNIGPTTRSVSGFVDPQDSSSSVSLYQFTLPSGNRWQLNAQLLSQAIGSPLTAGLTLFDAKGDVLAENNSGQVRRPTAPIPSSSRAWRRARITSGSPPPRT